MEDIEISVDKGRANAVCVVTHIGTEDLEKSLFLAEAQQNIFAFARAVVFVDSKAYKSLSVDIVCLVVV